MKKLLVGLCAVFALCFALAGCSGSGSDSLVGTWDYDEATLIEYVGEDLSDEQLAASKQLMFMNLNEDGTLEFVSYGDVLEGTWEQTDDGLSLAIDGEPAEVTYAEGKLTLDDGDAGMVFVKASEVRKAPTEDEANDALAALFGFSLDDLEIEGDYDDADYKAIDLADLDPAVVIADDDTCTITATGVGMNGIGDPGYQLSVANKTDQAIYVAVGDFTVDGNEVLAYADETVEAGETLDVFLGFDAADLGDDASADSLASVVGSIEIDDDETLEEIATYEVSL